MADEAQVDEWPSEPIPESDRLFMRVHKTFVKDGLPTTGAFKNRPTDADGMSTDWERYSTPEESRNRARVPADNGVIQLVVGEVLKIPEQTVKHTPGRALNNRAHTDVGGPKDAEARVRLRRIAAWVPGYEIGKPDS